MRAVHNRTEHPIRFAGSQPAKRHISGLLEYEARLNLVPDPKDPVVCAYDLTKFTGDVIMDVLRTHPAIIVWGVLQENRFFVPPEQFLHRIREPQAGRAAN